MDKSLLKGLHNKFISDNPMKDIVAGIIVALVSIPISMGYSQIAGLPIIYGLYGSLFPIIIFGIMSTSPQFVVGVDAMPAVMVGAVLSQLSIIGESREAMELVPVISLLVAVWFLVFYLMKAGRIVKYISTPVMGGFITGVGLTIIIMQIPKLFGGSTGTGELGELVLHIISETPSFNGLSFALGIFTIVIIMVCKKLVPRVPMTVIMMVVGAGLEKALQLEQYGVKMLSQVQPSLPAWRFPKVSLVALDPSLLVLESFSIAAVIMAQTLLASGNYAMKYSDKLDRNRELLAYSGMNMVAAFTGCCPINGSVSRSGIADSYGTRSQLMSISAGLSMLLVILFGTPLIGYLPVPILTGIVMTALLGILEFDLCGRLFRSSRREWAIFMMSMIAVLVFGTVNGVLIGCALSFADVAIAVTAPPTAYVGRIPGQGNFYALSRNSSARPIRNAIIYRFSGNLIFANIDKFQKDIESAIKEDTKCVVVDGRGIGSVDITSVDRLKVISNNLKKKGIDFYLTEHAGTLNDQLRELGGEGLLEHGQVRRTITLALRDSGIEKPYELEEVDNTFRDMSQEPDEQLAEFEWAFGTEAQSRLDMLARETADRLASDIHEDKKDILDEGRVQTSWGKLGRFDENEFWDYLELQLEALAKSGKLTQKELDRLEERIEERRIRGENRLQDINPHAIELLREHREKIREHFQADRPEEFAHMEQLQHQIYEQLKVRNPQLAEALKELHDSRD